jgi:predicted RNA-binding protein with RPS1 domain
VFLELGEGIEGLIHISEMGDVKVEDCKSGEELSAMITSIDRKGRKISLSMKELKEVTEKQDVAGYMETQETVTSPLGEKLKERLEEKRLEEEAAEAESVQASLPQDDHSSEQSEPDGKEPDASAPEKEPVALDAEPDASAPEKEPVALDAEPDASAREKEPVALDAEPDTSAPEKESVALDAEPDTDIDSEPKKE